MFGPILVRKYDTMVELTYSDKPTNLLKPFEVLNYKPQGIINWYTVSGMQKVQSVRAPALLAIKLVGVSYVDKCTSLPITTIHSFILQVS